MWSLPWSTKNPSGNQPATPARETKPNLLSTVGDCPFYPGQGTILRSLGHQTSRGAPGNIAWDNKGSFFILPDSSQGTNGAANTPAPGFLLPEDGGVRPRSPSLGYRPLLPRAETPETADTRRKKQVWAVSSCLATAPGSLPGKQRQTFGTRRQMGGGHRL